MDFVTNAPPVVGEGAFCKEEVGGEYYFGRDCASHGVCHHERVGDLRRWEGLNRDVDYGGEDDHPIGAMRCWVANDDMKSPDEKELRPWISPHRRCAGRVRRDGARGEA